MVMAMRTSRPNRLVTALVAAAAALPSLLWSVRGGDLLVDDWHFAAVAHFRGWGGFGPYLSRPLEGAYDAVMFTVFGDHPLPHILVLAALNGLAAVLVWFLARRLLPIRLAVLTTAVWVALPNRGSTRLWISNGPHVMSLCLLLGGALLASGPAGAHAEGRDAVAGSNAGRLRWALVLVVLAALAYEGSIALGALVVAGGAMRSGGTVAEKGRRLASVLTPVAATGALMFLLSPKHGAGANAYGPFQNSSRIIAAHFGTAVLPAGLSLIGALAMGVVMWSVVSRVLPGFDHGPEERAVLAGALVLVLGAAPFAAIGFPFATEGIFDRGNLFADLGTALVFAGSLAMAWRLRRPLIAVGIAAAVVSVLALGNVTDLRDWGNAAQDGSRLLDAAGKIAMFVEAGNLSDALALRSSGRFPGPDIRLANTDTDLARMLAAGYRPYHLNRGRLDPGTAPQP